VPGWPIFLDGCGEPLDLNDGQRRARIERWRSERTVGVQRPTLKRRHHLRTRRCSRERYRATMAAMPGTQLTWEAGVGKYRPLSPSDVQLPSPPSAMSALMRTRRLMLLPRLLPTGCRLRSLRSTVQQEGSEAQPSKRKTSIQPTLRKRHHHEPSPDIIIAAPQDDTL